MIKDAAGFRRELEKQNPHWLTGMPEEETRYPNKREELEAIYSDRELKKISMLTGPRRAGKTVLLRHMIGRLIKAGVKSRNLLYCSLDNSRLAAMCGDLVRDVIDFWLDGIAADGQRYIFLDEVHLLDGWYSGLKNFYDQNKDIKIYISGSASLAIQVKAEQYLRGRYLVHEIWPLDFKGFLKLECAGKDGAATTGLAISNEAGPPKDPVASDRQLKALAGDFKRYMLVGGFPESREVEDPAKWFDVLENFVAQKAVYTDIAATFNIRAVRVLDAIFHHIVQNQSRILTYESINQVAGLKHEVLLDYIEYLKGSYLVVEVRKLAATVREQLGSRKKFLCVDQGLRNAILAEYEIKEDNEGFVAENIVGMHLYLAASRSGKQVFYWKGNGEIDFVVKGRDPVLVEVKYRNHIDEGEISKVRDAMDATGAKLAYIVSKRDFAILKEKGRTLRIIPAAVFCRWVGEYLAESE
jgi:uncharacterized protein